MLYSLNFIERGHVERRLFYAKDEGKAQGNVRLWSERTETPLECLWLERHPHGYIQQRKYLGPRYWPAREPKKRGKRRGSS